MERDLRFLTFDELICLVLDRGEAEDELFRRYGAEASLLVCDFTGMVERSDAEGIVYALAMARRAEQVMLPAVRARGGELVKRVADTFFAAFHEPMDALLAAFDAHRRLASFNRTRTGMLTDGSRNEPIGGCIGLGHGRMLLIPGFDAYGEEVNRAFVLGEDVAETGEVLCSQAFLAALGAPPEGIGAFLANEDRLAEAGFDFHVLRDYRDG